MVGSCRDFQETADPLPHHSAETAKGPLGKKKTMTMTKIPSRKPSGTYGHGPLKICFCKGKDDDHDQDFLKKDLLHIWSWSSEKSMAHTSFHGQIYSIFGIFCPIL